MLGVLETCIFMVWVALFSVEVKGHTGYKLDNIAPLALEAPNNISLTTKMEATPSHHSDACVVSYSKDFHFQ